MISPRVRKDNVSIEEEEAIKETSKERLKTRQKYDKANK